ncbi:MAG TPA: hypothetical protein VFL42_08980, partial [Terriglobales bacterium]|nr:hypothetical protein [Terriglobales bacterium]
AAPSHISLIATELKEASTVLANDPFRAVQALPGVSAADNNDFFGQFSVAGAPFERVSVYVDDVLVPEPFHSIPGFREGASLSVFSSETVQSLDLMPVAFPEKFADATGAALAVRTREGSRTRPHFTVSAGMADSDVIAEGGLGRSGKGSWLASARKSYLDYLIHRPTGDPFTNVSFQDADLKLSYDVAPRQNVNFYFLDGHTDVSRHDPLNTLNDLDTGSNDFTLGRLAWRYAVTSQLLLDSDAAYIRQRFDTKNLNRQVLNSDYYGEWVLATRTTWSWSKAHILEAGYSGRRLRDTSYSFFFTDQAPDFFQRTDGTAFRQSGYVQQASNFLRNRVHLMAGLRWDSLQRIETQPVSSQLSIAWQAASATTLNFGYGRYAQFDVGSALQPCVPPPPNLPPGFFAGDLLGRSNHFVAGVEQRLSENLRARAEGFVRENREVFGERTFDGNGCGSVGPARNFRGFSFRDYARGGQFIIQRRSANRLSGWLGYTLNYARQRDSIFLGNGFGGILSAPTAEDQRHTLNAFATYRLMPTINLSGKFRYGSGMPITALDFQVVGNTVVAASPASERLGAYQRLDFRCDKAWPFAHWKMTLYAEVLNLTNHNNPRFITTSFDPITNRATAVTERGLPVTPTAGLTFEF